MRPVASVGLLGWGVWTLTSALAVWSPAGSQVLGSTTVAFDPGEVSECWESGACSSPALEAHTAACAPASRGDEASRASRPPRGTESVVRASAQVRGSRGGSVVDVALPAWVGTARCRVERLGAVVTEVSGPAQRFACPSAGELVRCDFEAAEPVDVALADVCRAGRLPLAHARRVSVENRSAEALGVQWLAITGEGELRLLATRAFAPVETLDLRVAPRPDRFVRIVRAGASPVTVAATEVLKGAGWRIPARQPGGEVVGRIESARVLPIRYRLQGPLAVEVEPRGTWLAAAGLRPGLYRMLPVYEGGPTGQPLAVAVREGDSSVVLVRAEAVGAVRFTVDPSLCAQTSELRVSRFIERADAAEPVAEQAVATLVTTAGCDCSLAGLAAGRYRATLMGPTGTVAGEQFRVAVQETVEVLLLDAGVSVSGRVVLNDRPLGDVRLEFFPFGRAGRAVATAEVDATGQYLATLPAPGRYHVRLLRGKRVLLGQTRDLEVSLGPNTLDWSLTGGSLALRVHGWDRQPRLFVRVLLEGAPRPQTVMFTGQISEADLYPSRLEGLAFGTYRVLVFQQEPSFPRIVRTSREARVTLDAEHPDRTVEVELLENRATLVVRDEEGAAVHGARLTPGAQEVELSPGVFSLRSVPPGTPVRVWAPGLVPACRLAASEGTLEVVLRRGRPVELRFSRATSPTPGYLLIDGWDCPVPLSLFEAHPLPPTDEGATRTRIENFPTADPVTFLWMRTGERQRLVVREGEPVFVRLPGGGRW